MASLVTCEEALNCRHGESGVRFWLGSSDSEPLAAPEPRPHLGSPAFAFWCSWFQHTWYWPPGVHTALVHSEGVHARVAEDLCAFGRVYWALQSRAGQSNQSWWRPNSLGMAYKDKTSPGLLAVVQEGHPLGDSWPPLSSHSSFHCLWYQNQPLQYGKHRGCY